MVKATKRSVVVPVYMGETFLQELYIRVRAAATALTSEWELILVNDASPDRSWEQIADLCKRDTAVKGVNLSRNFGQHYAITAGLTRTTGEWIVVMDCDLQDIPEEIGPLFEKAQEGYDAVCAKRVLRQDGFLKRMSSKLFYKIFNFLTDTNMDSSIANFGIYHRKVIDALLSMGDSIRYFPAMIQWVGFRRCAIPVRHAERKSGKSSYSFLKLCQLAVNTMLGFTDKPLRLSIFIGGFFSLFSLGTAAVYLFLAWFGVITVHGFASIIFSIWFIGGLLLMSLGVCGIYIGKIFSQVKNRPAFIISEEINRTEPK